MSTSSPAPGAAPADSVSPDGVYTYRGRTLEELIPRIRAELGADAIILREREGMMGGIAGFFAQRCVEVDARAGSRIDVYDDDLDDEDEHEDEPVAAHDAPGGTDVPAPDTTEPAAYEQASSYETDDPAAIVASRSAAAFVSRSSPPSGPFKAYAMAADPNQPPPAAPAQSAPAAPAQPAPAVPAQLAPAAPATSAPAAPAQPAPAAATPAVSALGGSIFDEASFAARLEEATIAAPEPAPAFIAFDELGEPATAPAQPEPEPAAEPEPSADSTREQASGPALAPVPAPEPEPAAEPTTVTPPASAPSSAAAPQPAPEHQPAAVAASAPRPAPAAARPYTAPAAGAAPRSASIAGTIDTLASQGRAKLAPMAGRMMHAAMSARSARAERRDAERRARAAAEAEARREHEARARARESERRESSEIERRLVDVGISQEMASRLVATAISHRQQPAAGSLTDGVRAVIAAALPAPRPPASGGAVAIIGAGGAGKTRSAAALASARARAGVTPVSVAGLATQGPENELGELLHGESVNVIPELRSRALARAVGNARERGLVVLDTCSATPGDADGINRLAGDLAAVAPDEIQLAVPATLSPRAALKLLESFAPLAPAGLIATHVDETDQLGTVVELAITSGIPITYTHAGLEVATAVEAADRGRLATRLL